MAVAGTLETFADRRAVVDDMVGSHRTRRSASSRRLDVRLMYHRHHCRRCFFGRQLRVLVLSLSGRQLVSQEIQTVEFLNRSKADHSNTKHFCKATMPTGIMLAQFQVLDETRGASSQALVVTEGQVLEALDMAVSASPQALVVTGSASSSQALGITGSASSQALGTTGTSSSQPSSQPGTRRRSRQPDQQDIVSQNCGREPANHSRDLSLGQVTTAFLRNSGRFFWVGQPRGLCFVEHPAGRTG